MKIFLREKLKEMMTLFHIVDFEGKSKNTTFKIFKKKATTGSQCDDFKNIQKNKSCLHAVLKSVVYEKAVY